METSGLMGIWGPPGTGKTYVLAVIVVNILLHVSTGAQNETECLPRGRACLGLLRSRHVNKPVDASCKLAAQLQEERRSHN